ncbi:MAG: LUD domain-containing protein [Bacteroidetes bacterium]|nr:LUD domain-containing protein [Bacteroidota bacterium]
MQDSTTREKVLKKIRNALISKTANPYPNLDFDSPVFRMNDEVPELIFAQAFKEAGGQFVFCNTMLDFAEGLLNLAQTKKWTQLLCVESPLFKFLNECEFPLSNDPSTISTTHASVTLCECLVARTGSIMVSSAQTAGRGIPLFTPVHIVVAFPGQLVDDLKDAFNFIKSKYKDNTPSSTTFITGPSSTADIGNELVIGAQGPSELYLFLVDKPEW